jgi:hypothetical protein
MLTTSLNCALHQIVTLQYAESRSLPTTRVRLMKRNTSANGSAAVCRHAANQRLSDEVSLQECCRQQQQQQPQHKVLRINKTTLNHHVRLYTALLYSAVSRQFSATTDGQLSDGFYTPNRNRRLFHSACIVSEQQICSTQWVRLF